MISHNENEAAPRTRRVSTRSSAAAFGKMRKTGSDQRKRPLPSGIPWLDRWLGGGFEAGSISELTGNGVAVCRVAIQVMATNSNRRTLLIDLSDPEPSLIPSPKFGSTVSHPDPYVALTEGLAKCGDYELILIVGGTLDLPARPNLLVELQNRRFCPRLRGRTLRTATIFLTSVPWLFEPDALVEFRDAKIGVTKTRLVVKAVRRLCGEITISDPQV